MSERTMHTVSSMRRLVPAALGLGALLVPALALADEGSVVQPQTVAFWALSLLTVGSAAMVAFNRNIVYSAFSLLGTFLGVAGLYVFLSADFLAVAQILIYVGGVLVLILFAVMLTSRISDLKVSNQSLGVVPAAIATLLTTGLLIYLAGNAPWKVLVQNPVEAPTSARLGELFLNRYLLPFEIASVVLLATLIGAVVMARKEIKPD